MKKNNRRSTENGRCVPELKNTETEDLQDADGFSEYNTEITGSSKVNVTLPFDKQMMRGHSLTLIYDRKTTDEAEAFVKVSISQSSSSTVLE